MNSITDLSAVIFSKDLPQSSLVMDRSKSFSGGEFKNAPRTLFEEMGREFNEHEDLSINDNRTQQFTVDSEFSWKSLVRRLREENTSLLNTVQSTKTELLQTMNDKARLEDIVIRQEEMIRGLQDQLDIIAAEKEQQFEASQIPEDSMDQNHFVEEQEEKQEEEVNALEQETDHARLNNLFERKAQLIERQRDNDKNHDPGSSSSPLTPFPIHHQQNRSENDLSTERLLAAVYEAQDGYALEHERRAELVFQKRYLMLVNKSLETCELQTLEYLKELGIPHKTRLPSLSPISKWRACFTAIIATHRFRKLISEE